jgi:hypothetical protein
VFGDLRLVVSILDRQLQISIFRTCSFCSISTELQLSFEDMWLIICGIAVNI